MPHKLIVAWDNGEMCLRSRQYCEEKCPLVGLVFIQHSKMGSGNRAQNVSVVRNDGEAQRLSAKELGEILKALILIQSVSVICIQDLCTRSSQCLTAHFKIVFSLEEFLLGIYGGGTELGDL